MFPGEPFSFSGSHAALCSPTPGQSGRAGREFWTSQGPPSTSPGYPLALQSSAHPRRRAPVSRTGSSRNHLPSLCLKGQDESCQDSGEVQSNPRTAGRNQASGLWASTPRGCTQPSHHIANPAQMSRMDFPLCYPVTQGTPALTTPSSPHHIQLSAPPQPERPRRPQRLQLALQRPLPATLISHTRPWQEEKAPPNQAHQECQSLTWERPGLHPLSQHSSYELTCRSPSQWSWSWDDKLNALPNHSPVQVPREPGKKAEKLQTGDKQFLWSLPELLPFRLTGALSWARGKVSFDSPAWGERESRSFASEEMLDKRNLQKIL